MQKLFTLLLFIASLQLKASPSFTTPTTPASAFTATSNDGDRINLNWTSGSGTKRIIIARKEAVVSALPVNGFNYNAVAAFGSGNEVAAGEFIVFNGSGNNTTVTNLQPGTQYHFTLFEYNGTGSSVEYLMTGTSGNAFTITAPAAQVSNLTISNIIGHSMKLSWTNPLPAVAGSGRIVIGREGAPVNINPQDLANYSANSQFGDGTEIGSGNFVLSKSNANNFTAGGLKPNTQYYFSVFEYKGSSGLVFNIANPPTASATTAPRPSVNTSAMVFSLVEGNSMKLAFTKGNGSRRMVIAKAGSAVTTYPADGIVCSPNTIFGKGDSTAPGEYVIYNGVSDNVTLTGLEKGTIYHFVVVEYDGTGATTAYFIASPLTASKATVTAPTIASSDISVTAILNNSVTISWINGDGARRLVVVKKDAPVDAMPVDFSQYGGSSSYGSGTPLGTGNMTVYNSTGSSVTITNLAAGTTYHLAIYEFNGSSAPVYLTANAPVAQFTTGQAPTQVSTGLQLSNIEGNRLSVSWTSGNGARRMAVVKAGSPVTAIPQDGTAYSGNSIFENGNEIAVGEYVILNGSGNNITFTNLNAATTYHVAVFEYNLVNNIPYYLSTPARISGSTVSAPTTNSTDMQFPVVAGNNMKLTWTKGNGARRIVIARKNNPVNVLPADFTNYSDNEIFGSGSQIGSGNYVVYEGTGNTVTITGLDPQTSYHYAVFEYNGLSYPVYLAGGALMGSWQTADRPTVTASNINFSGVEGNRMTLRWTNGNGAKRILVGRAGSPVTATPVDGTDYNSNLSFGNVPITTDEFVLADGIMFESQITNLQPNTAYHFALFEYDGEGANIRYFTTPGASSQFTLSAPADGPANVLFSSVGTTTASVNWTGAVGAKHIVIMHKGSPVTELPQQLKSYSANAAFGTTGALISNGHYTVFNGSTNSVNVSGLQPGATYHISVVAFNGHIGPVYNTTNVATGTVTTLGPPTDAATNVLVNLNNAPGSVNINWTNGSGQKRVVLMKAGGAVNAMPADNVAYIANNFFGSGQQIGSNNFVVYNGTADNIAVNNLQLGQTYHIAVFEYNQFATGPVYLTTTVARGQLDSWVLPVKLQSFTGVAGSNSNVLSWTTASETNSAEFIIERSANGNSFETIGLVAAAGNSNTTKTYRYEDNSRFPLSFYRLRMIDINGSNDVSSIIRLQVEAKTGEVRLYPTTVTSSVQVNLTAIQKTTAILSVIDMSGRMMMQQTKNMDRGVTTISIDVSRLVRGHYLLQVQMGEKMLVDRFVKQ